MKNFFVIIFVSILFCSCQNLNFFERSVSIPQQNWNYNLRPIFSFKITDTTARYNIFVVLRHTDAYKYNNIWIKAEMRFPGDTLQSQNIDIPLASDASGWKGSGMDDIFEIRKTITPGPIPFKKPGIYSFSLSQIMRENPLEHVLNVGIRIEKVIL